MSNFVRYHSEKDLRVPSPNVWGTLSKHQDDAHFGKCIHLFDDFGFPLFGTNTNYTYQDTGVIIGAQNAVPDIGDALGVLEVSGNDADNDEGHIKFGGQGENFRIDDNFAGNTARVFFGCRFNVASIADNSCAFFMGLGSGTMAANHLVDDTGALIATEGFIGIRRLNDDGDKADIVFQDVSQAINEIIVNAVTLVANTWVKFEFTYNPAREDAKKIKFYVNGVEQSTYVTAALIGGATFPEDIGLQPMLLTKVGTAAESLVRMDWVAATQYYDGL